MSAEPTRRRRSGRTALAIGIEIPLAVGACLVFYAVFLAILGAVFPQGTGLRDLIRARNPGADLTRPARQPASRGRDSASAVLTVLSRDVRTKLASEIAWRPASNGAVLGGGDGVQTSSRGEAEVAFGGDNQVRLGRNTLIVIKQPGQGWDSNRRRSAVAVVSGEVWAQLSPNAEHVMDLQIEAGGAQARMRPAAAKTEKSTFKVTVAPDRGPTFAVYGGTADIEAQGKMVRLTGNQFTTVESIGPSAPRNLLPAPSLAAPEDGEGLPGSPGGFTFSWQAIEGAQVYRVLVARDPGFGQRVFDQRTEKTALPSGALAAGEYWWRVTGIQGGLEGLASAPRRFTVERSAAGPALQVGFPPAVVRASRYRLTGTTTPGATVLAGGKRVVADASGRFTCEATLKRGVNVLVVEAIDAEGRSSYSSAVVNAKF